ncbi:MULTISPECIES: lysozyme inhibitor LprI family protein [Limnospira]|uniref:Lysozyme inhibitor LprI family protein n=1 Tax=Limnospira fusiformis PMC 851.14 TaxID=2219512 RepID=A0ABU9ESK5_LIMFS|nr:MULTISPECIES: lysozyme inhibitor LprI family protein [unclassified Limnospira]MDY7051587.1 lysozyme inhibitor LprI family protein [Limnospira fusiformis LS22]QJB28409.1 DUF1311 domain-containing protein [Limnospira fusiformis SAG 85.79]RAQ45715.1 hypothetical protein B9S53_07365 [Arthrospira sp. O9.13F]MDT9190172.1 lysozyme inhibitor LprI family protein [Limnospira sp. PMC 894.15]MDT9236106.1 lysozyme inhibitor LprI family protein [Limnospira sp. PMC 917.15]
MLNKCYLFGALICTGTWLGFIEANSQVKAQSRCEGMNTQADLNACAIERYRNADAQLNSTYQRLTSMISADRRQKLVQAQLSWIQFRDNHCSFVSSTTRGGGGGSMSPVIVYSCLTLLTQNRTNDFNHYIQSQLPKPLNANNLGQSERAINRIYQGSMNHLSGEARTNLQRSQSSWLNFRNLNCQFEGTFASGGQNLCLTRMSQERHESLSKNF